MLELKATFRFNLQDGQTEADARLHLQLYLNAMIQRWADDNMFTEPTPNPESAQVEK